MLSMTYLCLSCYAGIQNLPKTRHHSIETAIEMSELQRMDKVRKVSTLILLGKEAESSHQEKIKITRFDWNYYYELSQN